MALYKYAGYVAQADDEWFDEIHAPGTTAPCSGIDRCEGCGREIVAHYGHPLPPRDHHRHGPDRGEIRWRLIVW